MKKNLRIVFLEGMPLTGKTTLLEIIKSKKYKDVHIVPEIVSDCSDGLQESFMNNDIKKINMYKSGIIIIDRGLISTLSYNMVLNDIGNNANYNDVINWFEKYGITLYKSDFVMTFYLKKKNHQLRYKNSNDPYGSLENQELLEKTTIDNIKKYCKNYKIIDYDYEDALEAINEIIN